MSPRAGWLLAALVAVSAAAVIGVGALGGAMWLEATAHGLQGWIVAYPVSAAVLFALWAIAANVLVLPLGTLSLLLAGGVANPVVAAMTWWLAQVATAPVVHVLGGRSLDTALLERLTRRVVPSLDLDSVVRASARDGFALSVLLRLAPFLPSAPAALVAAGLAIPVRTFTLATFVVGWLRPLYFTMLGATLGATASPSAALTWRTFVPLVVVFAAVVGAVGLRIWLIRRVAAPK